MTSTLRPEGSNPRLLENYVFEHHGLAPRTGETVCRNVKRWRDGDLNLDRTPGRLPGLLVADRQFRRSLATVKFPCCSSSTAND